MQSSILVLGNSHAQALKDALAIDHQSGNNPGIDVKWTYGPTTEKPVGDLPIHEAMGLVADLKATDIIGVCYAGTFHNILGFLKHDLPFDVAPRELSGDARAKYIPVNVMRAQFFELNKARTLIPNIKAATKASVYHIAPPPPKADEDFIKDRMKRYRGQVVEEFGLNPPSLRLKLWKIEMSVLESVCQGWGVGFVHSPPDACDKAGFLRREFYGADATHANVDYGRLVLSQLEQLRH